MLRESVGDIPQELTVRDAARMDQEPFVVSSFRLMFSEADWQLCTSSQVNTFVLVLSFDHMIFIDIRETRSSGLQGTVTLLFKAFTAAHMFAFRVFQNPWWLVEIFNYNIINQAWTSFIDLCRFFHQLSLLLSLFRIVRGLSLSAVFRHMMGYTTDRLPITGQVILSPENQ